MSTISARIGTAVTDMEHLLWRARLHRSSAMIDYLDPKCVFLSPEDGILGSTSSPKLMRKLKDDELTTFSTYEINDEQIVELDMMCASIVYKVVASKTDKKGRQTEIYRALCSSTWKQLASSKWKLCVHHEAPYEGEDEDEGEEQ